MDPLSFLKSIWKQSESFPIQDNRLTLRTGQIISGKIIKLLPNQLAEIQVGSTRLFAKLEAPLNINQQYYFQVQPSEEKIHLKLIKNSQEDPFAQTTKGLADVFINNSSQDRNVIEQFVTQVPIQLGQDTADVTIQWNGRKKENNKMDPNDCRILVYLELKNIGEILADLRIQNRKLSITLINGTPDINTLVESQIIILKENLHRLNYQLTSVKFEQPVSEKSLKTLIKKTVPASVELNRKSGVDIRV